MLRSLSEQQKAAVIESGHVLITACPGSGKTRVLTFKIAHELKKIEESKKTIVALTFTNRAADEIKERISRMNVEPKAQLWAGTIHSFCLDWILRPYKGYLDELKNGFVIADEHRSEEIISALKEKYSLPWYTRILTRINADGSLAEITNIDLVKEYHSILKTHKLIDFDQMLYFAYALLDNYPKIAKTLNNIFHLICVDEYQDTQELQYAILSKIIKAQNGKTLLFIVGDKDQAIYVSLGGVAKSLNEIKAQFGNIEMREKELSGNYRSNQRIIDYYRNFQSTNIDIKSLCKYSDERGLISFSNQEVHKDVLDETIASLIQENIAKGVPEHEICVLAPQWWLIIPMGRKLKKLLPSVNFDAPGLSPLIRNRENTWYKFARLFLVDPAPNMYHTRTRWAAELLNELDGIGVHLFPDDERRTRSLLKSLNAIKSDRVNGLEFLHECFSKACENLKIKVEENEYLKLHWDSFFEGAKKRLENREFDYATDVKSFKRLFSHNSGVVVNTCHGIKGEEFQTVIAFGLLHGYIPNWNEEDAQSTAKKLLYVICSRAKNNLYLISETGRTTQRGRPYATTGHLQTLSYTYDGSR
ncbi:MAG: ATP-dependent DNA helicase Rep [Bacteroidia bacterium]|nr:ATP-dependent DNA helicase Rep [Bacteroidia bacterium]